MKSSSRPTCRGFSLLELITATAMLAVLTSASMVIVRTSYTAWSRHEDDHAQRQAGISVLKHIVRRSRQCRAVADISLPSDNSGSLTLLDTNGNLLVWEHDAGSKEVRYGITTATNVLATGIETLTFVGLKVDGITPTTEVGLIHSVDCTTTVNLARPAGTDTVTASSQAWIRSW